MWRGHKLVVGITGTTVAVLCGLGLPAGPQSNVPVASAATTTNMASVAAKAVPTPRGKPTFDATFHGLHLDAKIWGTCYPWTSKPDCTNFGNPEEAEWYVPSQVQVSGGVIHLVAQRKRTVGTTSTGTRKVYGCRSGMITSYPGFKFEYGFVQVVADIPHAEGLWPALWLAAANKKFPAKPEIDMVESWGVNQTTGSFYHPVTGRHSRATYSPKLTVGWHTYSLSWTRSTLAFYVDSRLVLTVTKNVPRQRMYFLADLAEYTPAKRGYCTGQLSIKSVKIWKA
jgi:beta-glucanase (GH16 family)